LAQHSIPNTGKRKNDHTIRDQGMQLTVLSNNQHQLQNAPVQEIGQATSMILEINQLLAFIMKLWRSVLTSIVE